ncbi:hypothetical protein [Clostridium perfringens]
MTSRDLLGYEFCIMRGRVWQEVIELKKIMIKHIKIKINLNGNIIQKK